MSPSTGAVQNPVASPATAVSAPSASSAEEAIAADYPIGEAGDAAVYDEEAGAGTVEDGIQVIDTAPGDAVKEPAAAASSQLGSVADTPIAQLATNSVSASAASASDDDDEEEEEDDITDALDDDDDDEDEEETEADAEEEDDDEDDLIGEDVIEARARESRSNKQHNGSGHRSAKKRKASHVAATAKGKRTSQKPNAANAKSGPKKTKTPEAQS